MTSCVWGKLLETKTGDLKVEGKNGQLKRHYLESKLGPGGRAPALPSPLQCQRCLKETVLFDWFCLPADCWAWLGQGGADTGLG